MVNQRNLAAEYYVQQQQYQIKIWDGSVEWQEKDRNNPNSANKVTHVVNAQMISFTVLDHLNGQYVPEVSGALAQGWPQKILLHLISKQIFDILNAYCAPQNRKLLLLTDGSSLDLKSIIQSIGVNTIFGCQRLYSIL